MPNLISNSISLSQHGFLSKHSIYTNILVTQHFLIKNCLNRGCQVDSL